MIGFGATVAGLSAGSSVIASEHTSLYFETIDVERDFVVIGNAGDEDFDLSGYIIDWEYNQDQDQTDEIPDGIVVPAGGSVKLASGYDESAAEDADHDFGYEAGRIRDDGTDTVTIHEPGMGSVVIISDDHTDPPEDSGRMRMAATLTTAKTAVMKMAARATSVRLRTVKKRRQKKNRPVLRKTMATIQPNRTKQSQPVKTNQRMTVRKKNDKNNRRERTALRENRSLSQRMMALKHISLSQ